MTGAPKTAAVLRGQGHLSPLLRINSSGVRELISFIETPNTDFNTLWYRCFNDDSRSAIQKFLSELVLESAGIVGFEVLAVSDLSATLLSMEKEPPTSAQERNDNPIVDTPSRYPLWCRHNRWRGYPTHLHQSIMQLMAGFDIDDLCNSFVSASLIGQLQLNECLAYVLQRNLSIMFFKHDSTTDGSLSLYSLFTFLSLPTSSLC